jgi:hypothetical protein
MARACGLRIGPRRFELVVLDGSPRKHKIVAYMAGELPVDPEGGLGPAVVALREAARKHHVPRDNVGVAVDTGLAAFRSLRMPFTDRAKIESVLKFEIESQLSQWNIDDVVVDFLVLGTAHESSELLVTAVPKQELRRIIGLCEKAGVDPLECELEATAMVNAACVADVCQADSAEVLVHVGEHSTSVVVMDGGRVREMRAIHIGALTHLQGLQRQEAAPEGAEPLEPAEPESAADEPAAEPAEGAAAEIDALLPEIDPLEVQLRIDQSIKRIRRELGRTISAARTAHPVAGIYVCGLELPGLVGTSVLDIPVQVLDVFEEDGGQPVEGFGALVVPYGVAVRQLGGGVLKPSLRREELRYAGKLEKVELPLAVVCLLTVTFLGIWNIFNVRQWGDIDVAMKVWRDSTKNYMLGSMKSAGYLEYPSDEVKAYASDLDADEQRNVFEQMQHIKFMLSNEIRDLEKDLGQDGEVTQPQSALEGLAAVLDVFAQNKDTVGRPSFRKLQATYQPGRPPSRPEGVRVTLDLTFFADSSLEATEHYEGGFANDLQTKPWFSDLKPVQSEPLETGEGIYLQGLAVNVDTSKLPAHTKRQEGTR